MNKGTISKIKNFFIFLKEAWKDPQKKSIIMLILMFLFFFLIVVSLRSNRSKNYSVEENSLTDNFQFSLEKIKASNYHYLYTVNIDDRIISYDGNKYNNKESFNYNGSKYFKYNDTYLKDYNGVWSKTDNPYLYSDFIDVDKVITILKNSMLESKTEYNDNKKIYNYVISTTTLIKILETKDIDLDDIVNKITLITDSSNNVVEINYDLSSYSIYKNYGNKVLLNIKYSLFGEVEEIENPK